MFAAKKPGSGSQRRRLDSWVAKQLHGGLTAHSGTAWASVNATTKRTDIAANDEERDEKYMLSGGAAGDAKFGRRERAASVVSGAWLLTALRLCVLSSRPRSSLAHLPPASQVPSQFSPFWCGWR